MECRGAVPGRLCPSPPSSLPRTELQLQQLEALHRVYDLYVWLAFRMTDAFPDRSGSLSSVTILSDVV